MALALEHRPVRRASGAQVSGTLVHLLRTVPGRLILAWRRHRVERELESLPFDLRKDIGFRGWDKTAR